MTAPQRKYVEIGIIDLNVFIEKADSFLEEVKPFVIKQGGDAVIAIINSKGTYVKGIVIKFKD